MYNLLLVDDEPLIKVAFQSAVEWGKNGFLLAATASNGQRWIRTIEASCSRFTVCPLWPLGNLPIIQNQYEIV